MCEPNRRCSAVEPHLPVPIKKTGGVSGEVGVGVGESRMLVSRDLGGSVGDQDGSRESGFVVDCCNGPTLLCRGSGQKIE